MSNDLPVVTQLCVETEVCWGLLDTSSHPLFTQEIFMWPRVYKIGTQNPNIY